jgi:hypothetical protein
MSNFFPDKLAVRRWLARKLIGKGHVVLFPLWRPLTEQKTEALSISTVGVYSAIDCMTVDFPTPAAPNTQCSFVTSVQVLMQSKHHYMIAVWVPGKHGGDGSRFKESHSAPHIVSLRSVVVTAGGDSQWRENANAVRILLTVIHRVNVRHTDCRTCY